ncbi:MAG: hypothetical protein ACTHMZ_11705 [Actinomycetes bacterium]
MATPAAVTLLQFPVELGMASRQHVSDWMREFLLIEIGGATDEHPIPQQLRETVHHLSTTYQDELDEPERRLLAAADWGDRTVDLVYPLAPESVEVVSGWEQLLLVVDEYCRTEHLLTLRRSPALVALQRWITEEFTRQAQGEAARSWSDFTSTQAVTA